MLAMVLALAQPLALPQLLTLALVHPVFQRVMHQHRRRPQWVTSNPPESKYQPLRLMRPLVLVVVLVMIPLKVFSSKVFSSQPRAAAVDTRHLYGAGGGNGVPLFYTNLLYV
jgi:uncharacterized membrane protein